MEHLLNYLKSFHLDPDDVKTLSDFHSRKGFRFVTQEEINDCTEFVKEEPRLAPIAPLFTDGQSDFICVYITGPLKGFVCYSDHEEIDLTPRFSCIANVVQLSKLHKHDMWFWFRDFPDEVFDYPSRQRWDATPKEQAIIAELRHELSTEEDEVQQYQLAFNIMALTPRRDISLLYPFLDHENMYIQERAIQLMGFYEHKEITAKLEELATTAKHNGKIAVRTVFRYWADPEYRPYLW